MAGIEVCAPCSKIEGKKEILSYLKFRFGLGENLTVLDVGAGSGAYGKLLREGMPKSRILGVEIFEPYVDRFGLEEIYDRVIVGDVLDEDFDLSPDVVIFGDVLEHMDRADALSVLRKFFVNSTVCVVSIPIIPFPQGQSGGNVHETHRHQWNFSTFKDDMAECGIPVRLCLKGRIAEYLFFLMNSHHSFNRCIGLFGNRSILMVLLPNECAGPGN